MAPFFLGMASSVVLYAFQQAGYSQDASFSILQATNVNHEHIDLPRLSLFKFIGDNSEGDKRGTEFARCQFHSSMLFIEYEDWNKHDEMLSCRRVSPVLVHLASGDNYYDDIIRAESDAEYKDKRMVDLLLSKIKRAVVLNVNSQQIVLISGYGAAATGTPDHTHEKERSYIRPNRNDMVDWYIGIDETYDHVVIGNHYIPYSPISNYYSSNSSSAASDGTGEFPFFIEPLYLPSGSVVAIDAQVLVPMGPVAEYFNAEETDELEEEKDDDIPSTWKQQNNGYKSYATRPGPEPAQNESLHQRKDGEEGITAQSIRRKRGVRDKYWIPMCSSIANGLQTKVHMRTHYDCDLSSKSMKQEEYELGYLTRPFVVSSGGPTAGPDTTAGRLRYWLDFCGQKPPHVHMLSPARGPQTYWVESEIKARNRKCSGSNNAPEGQNQNPSYCGKPVAGRPSVPRSARGNVQGPHVGTSAYASQSPCDVQYVRNLYMNGTAQSEDPVSSLLCVEDVLTSPHLVTVLDIGAHREKLDGDAQSTRRRLHTDWSVYSSSRGLASLWHTDPGLTRHTGPTASPHSNVEDFHLLRTLLHFERRFEKQIAERQFGRRESHDQKEGEGASQEDGVKKTNNESSFRDSEASFQSDVHVQSMMRTAGHGGGSLVRARAAEYTELLRMLRAFANTAQRAADDAKSRELEQASTHLHGGAEEKDAGGSLEEESHTYSTRLHVKALVGDMVNHATGKARTPSSALLLNSFPFEKTVKGAGIRKMVKNKQQACDMHSSLLSRGLLYGEYKVTELAQQLKGFFSDNSLHHTMHSLVDKRLSRSVEEFANDVVRQLLSFPGEHTSLHDFRHFARGKIEDMRRSIRANPAYPTSCAHTYATRSTGADNQGDHWYTPGSRAGKDDLRFQSFDGNVCGSHHYWMEADYTEVALSFRSALRRYLFPVVTTVRGSKISTDSSFERESGEIFVCEYLTASFTEEESMHTASRFLSTLRESVQNARYNVRGKISAPLLSFTPYLCSKEEVKGGSDKASFSLKFLVEELSQMQDMLLRSTQQLQEIGPIGERSGTINGSIYEKVLSLSSHQSAISALGNTVEQLRNYVEGYSLYPRVNKLPNQTSTDRSPGESLNLKMSGGESNIYLFVFPHELALAQELVDRWRKKCGGDVCFIYINYHIVVLGSDSDVAQRNDEEGKEYQETFQQYDEEVDIGWEDAYLNPYRNLYFEALQNGQNINKIESISSDEAFDLNAIGDSFDEYADEYSYSDVHSETWVGMSKEAQTGNAQNQPRDSAPDSSRGPSRKKAFKYKHAIPSFEGELSGNTGTPSLRQALLALEDALEASITRSDVVLACVGLESCLGLQIPGGKENIHIPPGAYAQERRYFFPSPLFVQSGRGSKTLFDVRAFGGPAYAVRRFIKASNHMPFLGEKELRESLERFCDANVYDVRAEHTGDEEDHFWVSSDEQQSLFQRDRGSVLYKQMTAESAIYTAKSLLMESVYWNKANPNNAIEDVVDILDNGNSVNIFQDNIVFNVSFCSEVHYLATYGPTSANTDREMESSWLKGDKMGHPPSGMVTPSTRYEPVSDTIRLRKLMGTEHGRKGWYNAVDERGSCGVQRARLLVLAFLDDHTGTSHHLGWDKGRGGQGNDSTIINTYTIDGRIQGYDSLNNEKHTASTTPMPLVPYDNGVFRMMADKSSGGQRQPMKDEAFGNVIENLRKLVSSGCVWGALSLTLQLERAILQSFDCHDNLRIQDVVLLKLFELTKFSRHYVQYTPIASYRRGAQILHAHMYSLTEWMHFGRNPYEGSDYGQNPSLFSTTAALTYEAKAIERNASTGASPSIDGEYKNYAFSGGEAEEGRPPKGSGNGNWGERGARIAARTASDSQRYADSTFYPYLYHDLLPGQGRGPVPMTDLGLEDEGVVQRELTSVMVSAQGINEFPNQDPVAEAQGREVFGNPLAAGTYALLSSYSLVTGPYDAMIGAYTKSIAYPDYFGVKSRQRLWDRQSKQLSPVRTATGAEGVVTHYLTMANKMTDKLNNLIFSANLAGIPLIIVGLKDKQSGEAEPKEFNYSDKVEAFHKHFQRVRPGTPAQGREGLPVIADGDVVVMVDAYDVLLFPHARTIGRHFQQSKGKSEERVKYPIMFCTELGIYPEYSSAFTYQRGAMYDRPEECGDGGDWAVAQKFLNSGCIAGRAGQVRAMVRAAYSLGDAFRNDQQFYARYQSTYPDLVGLDYHRKLFFTGHKMLSCQSVLLLDNTLSVSHYTHSNKQTYNYNPPALWDRDHGAKDNAESARNVSEIGVFHANNIKANRQYDVLVRQMQRLMIMHLNGPDQQGLLDTIHAIADEDYDRAAYLLCTAHVQTNFTSNGGTNLLGDILIVKYRSHVEPALVRLAMSGNAKQTTGNAFTPELAQMVAKNVCDASAETWKLLRKQATASANVLDAEELKKAGENLDGSPVNRGEFKYFNDDGSIFIERQMDEIKYIRKVVDNCH